MNTGILTIDSSFVVPVGTAAAQPRPDARHAEKASLPVAEEISARADSVQAEATDNITTDADKQIADKPTREFRQVLRERTGADSSAKPHSDGELKEDSPPSDVDKPQNAVQTWLAENAIGVPQSKDGGPAKLEPKAGRELAQLISGLKAEKSPPATGHAAKSAQIKALHITEKGQLGIKTVLPDKSNGQNGLKAVSPANAQPAGNRRTDNIVALGGSAADAKTLSDKTNVKSRTVAGSGAGRVEGVPPSNRGQDARDTSNLKSATSETAANLVEKQSQAAPSDGGKDAQHLKTGIRQTQAESSNAGGKDSALGVAKSATIEAHVSEDQGNSPGWKTGGSLKGEAFGDGSSNGGHPQAPQGVPQGLPLEASTRPTASQSTTAAGNARPANLPGQNSAADVSADIGRQILESIHGSPSQQGAERQITVRLNPPELGRVFIKLQEHESGLTGILEVSRSQTRFEIEHALPEIVRNLAECGVQVRRFDVVLSEHGRSEQEAFGGQSMPNNGRYGHNPADQWAAADEADLSALSEWSPNGYGVQNFSEPAELLAADGSINMLI